MWCQWELTSELYRLTVVPLGIHFCVPTYPNRKLPQQVQLSKNKPHHAVRNEACPYGTWNYMCRGPIIRSMSNTFAPQKGNLLATIGCLKRGISEHNFLYIAVCKRNCHSKKTTNIWLVLNGPHTHSSCCWAVVPFLLFCRIIFDPWNSYWMYYIVRQCNPSCIAIPHFGYIFNFNVMLYIGSPPPVMHYLQSTVCKWVLATTVRRNLPAS